MIENIRRYTGLIFIVIVVLILGFIFMDTSGFFRGQVGGGATAIKIDDENYSQEQYRKLGSSALRLSGALRGFDASGLEIMRFSNTLVGSATSEDEAVKQFFINRVQLQKAADEFGIHPSDNDVDEFIRTLSAFSDAENPMAVQPGEGKFAQAKYNQFVERQLGAFGMGESDFRALISDVIAASKIRQIVGGGLLGARETASAMTVENTQKVEVALSTVDTKPIREAIQPSDEELKSYWDTTKDSYQTDQQLKVSYVIAKSPDPTPADSEDQAAETTAEDPEEADQTGEAESEEVDAEATARAKALAAEVDTLMNKLQDAEGENFEALIEEGGWDLVSTDLFTRETLPPELKIQPRATSAGKQVVDHLFELNLGPDPLARFTGAIAVGENEWLLARLDESVMPREKTFDEAKPEVQERYINEKADEKIKQTVDGKIDTIQTALGEGKTFAEAAKSVELEVRELGPYGIAETQESEPYAQDVFSLAATAAPGTLAEPFYREDQAIIIYLKGREVVKDENRGQQVDNFMNNLASQNENAAFSAWLKQGFELAEVEAVAP